MKTKRQLILILLLLVFLSFKVILIFPYPSMLLASANDIPNCDATLIRRQGSHARLLDHEAFGELRDPLRGSLYIVCSAKKVVAHLERRRPMRPSATARETRPSTLLTPIPPSTA